jgi:hypothetical protein
MSNRFMDAPHAGALAARRSAGTTDAQRPGRNRGAHFDAELAVHEGDRALEDTKAA